jgi:ABC-type uncharacterized transport system auxiliary subunit
MRQTIRAPLLWIAVATVACWAGCGGSQHPIAYYTLNPPLISDPPAVHYDVTLTVGRVNAPTVLRDDRILYRTGANQMGFYQTHHWSQPPPELVRTTILRTLRRSGQYQAVSGIEGPARGDFILQGWLHDFEEVDGQGILARIELRLELVQVKTGKVLWSHLYSRDEPVSGHDVPAVVAALNRNLDHGLEETLSGLNEYFRRNPPHEPPIR